METTATATFCSTLVDEWVRAGVTHAFVAPGSRSTPLALALAAEPNIKLSLFHDERAAGFAALGYGLATGRPGVLVCTSGTAATHFHGPVVEADLSAVPLIVATADRPPELWSVGAPQTIDQTHLYGSAPRWFAEPGVPDWVNSSMWRSMAARTVIEARGRASSAPGPVHLNLSFRDPLVGLPGPLPEGRADGQAWHGPVGETKGRAGASPATDAVLDQLAHQLGLESEGPISGVLVVGRGGGDPDAINHLATRAGWPILADHRSGCRHLPHSVLHFDALLRHRPFAATYPRLIVRLGEGLASKSLSQWIGGARNGGALVVSGFDQGRWTDPERACQLILADGTDLAALVSLFDQQNHNPSGEAQRWLTADDRAAQVINQVLTQAHSATESLSEVEVMREVISRLEAGSALVVSSSMPVRDLEWYGPARQDVEVFSNRGANGIDGVVATGVGVALSGRPTTVVLGDVAMTHDSSALTALRARPVDLNIVVINNDGGGIFSFLPQRQLLSADTFETLFGTPHGTDFNLLFGANGIPVDHWPNFAPPTTGSGIRATLVQTDREYNHQLRDRMVTEIGAGL